MRNKILAIGAILSLAWLAATADICTDSKLGNCQAGGFGVDLASAVASIYDTATAVWTFNDPADLGNQDAGSCASCDLTEVATPTATGGALGYGTDFEADSTQATTLADNASISQGSNQDFGFCVWLRPESVTGQNVVYKGNDYRLRPLASSTEMMIFDSVSGDSRGSSAVLVAGVRVFLCGWYDSSDKKAYSSIDDGTPGAGAALSNFPVDGTSALEIPPQSAAPYDGELDAIVYYKGSIPPVTSLWNSGKGKDCADMSGSELTNRESCWEMTENGGPYVDSQGSNNLTGVNTPTRVNGLVERSDSGMSGRVLNADGSYFEDTSFVVDYSTGLWVACWVNDGVGDAGSEVLWRVSDAGIEGILLSLGTNVFTGTVKADVSQSTGTAAYTQGQWHLVEAWWDSSDKKLYIAVDNSTTSSSSATGRAPANSTRIRFGDDFGGGVVPFETAFDNCAMWEKTPTTVERDALWDSGAGTFYAAFLDFIFDGPRFAWSAPPEIRRAES